MKLEELRLSPNVVSGLKDVNHTELTELQQSILSAILEGEDAFIKAEPGNERIASFIIPTMEHINQLDERTEDTVALILTPNTDEAKEIDELVWAVGYHSQIECASVDLDSNLEEQREALHSGVEVLVGNPGPLLDNLENLRHIFRKVDLLIIDAADEILSLNLKDKLDKIKRRILSDPQILIYTDQVNEEVTGLAKEYLDEPEIVGFDGNANPHLFSEPPSIDSALKQGYINVPNRMKITTLMAHIENTPTDTCVIFTASKRGTDRLYKILRKKNLKATSLHGKLSEEKRAQRFANFANGDVQYLLVADIPAVELDLQRVTQVINYDVPNDPDEYRYRAGLVGSGKANRIVSLVSKQDRNDITALSNKLGQAPQKLPLPKQVKQKLEERKKKKSKNKKQKKKQPRKGRNNGHKKKKKDNDLQLPQPSYDKLSGGRKGSAPKDPRSGVIGLIKKLFS